MVAFNDFYQCHEPPPSGDAHGIARLPIPVFRNLFFGPKGFLFFLRFPEEIFTGTWFWRDRRNSCFIFAFTGIFRRNS
jgi:hypothetical protein